MPDWRDQECDEFVNLTFHFLKVGWTEQEMFSTQQGPWGGSSERGVFKHAATSFTKQTNNNRNHNEDS